VVDLQKFKFLIVSLLLFMYLFLLFVGYRTFISIVGYSLMTNYVLISAMHSPPQLSLGGRSSFYLAEIWVGLKGFLKVIFLCASHSLWVWVELKGLLMIMSLLASLFIEGSGKVEGLRVMPLPSSVLVHIPLPMAHSLTYAQCLKD
jgi:hypothetical protein